MTVNTTSIIDGPYAGNGVATAFAYNFAIDENTEIAVWETDNLGVTTLLTLTTHYTVTGVGNPAGGTAVRVAGALPSGYTWNIKANYALTQLTAFASQGGFFPDVHEYAFDKTTYIHQQQQDSLDRSLALKPYDTVGDMTLPVKADRLGNTLAFDAVTGLPIVGPSVGAISGAAAAAAAAAASASAASTSASNASTSASNAATSAANALTSENNAAASAASASATVAPAIHAAMNKATPVNADEFGIADSAAAWVIKNVTWANIKTALASIFASLSGSASQVFSVAAATAVAHAVRADQMQTQALTTLGTAGTSTAYTASPTPALAALTDGACFDLQMHVTNGASPTLVISGLTAKEIRRELASGDYVIVAAGELIQYNRYRFVYQGIQDKWIVRDCPARRKKVLSATRDMTAVSGVVQYTGCGFRPSKVTALSGISTTRIKSLGFCSSTEYMCMYSGSTAGYDTVTAIALVIQLSSTGGASQSAVPTIITDGVQLIWTKIGSPAAETAILNFLCEE